MSRYPNWSKPEAEFLEQLAGSVPFADLVARHQRQAQRQGWPYRSRRALLQRLHRTGHLGGVRQGEWLTTGGVADLLGCPRARVEAWLRRPRIAAIVAPRWIGKQRYCERRAWRRLAHEMPRVFGGFSADVLFLLLEDRDLADEIVAAHPRTMGDWRVRCVETGRVWPSASAAARELHVTQACISLAIRQRRPVRALGLTFEALRSAADTPQPLQVRNRAT